MEAKNLGNYLTQKLVHKCAMKSVSTEYPLTDEMLKKYRNELDWDEVSDNRNIGWTIEMIDRWENYLNWKIFSQTSNEALLTPEILEKFKDQWDWGELSGNQCLKLTFDLIDKYIDRWDWDRLINRWNDEESKIYSWEFLQRYEQHIPVEEYESSCLFNTLVLEESASIKKELVMGK
jgi:hypothetical protein